MIAMLALMACGSCDDDFQCSDPAPVRLGTFTITRSAREDVLEGEVEVDPDGYVGVSYRDPEGRSWWVRYRKVGGSSGGASELE